LVLPIRAQVFPALEKGKGKWVSPGIFRLDIDDLRQCLGAWLRFQEGQDLADYDLYLQLLGPEKEIELEGCTLAVAAAVLSSIKGIPLDPGTVLIGRLALGGEVLPLADIYIQLETALKAGIRRLVIPADNAERIRLESIGKGRLEIVPVSTLSEALSCISKIL
jgi:predicted ATP-dependent protease